MIRVGTIGEEKIPIFADIGGGLGPAADIVLLTDYTPESPPGLPTRPGLTGSAHPRPAILKAGTKIKLFAAEGLALVAAGAARVDCSKGSLITVTADGNRQPIPVSTIVSEIVNDLCAEHAADLAAALAAHLSLNERPDGAR